MSVVDADAKICVLNLFDSVMCFLSSLCAAASRELYQLDCEDDTCMALFDKCGGSFFNVSTSCCDPAESCVVKNFFYAQCLTEDKAGTTHITPAVQ